MGTDNGGHMYLELNPDEHLYIQIYESIKNKIISGEISEGFKLPSIRALSGECLVSKNTVSNAYYQLEIEGYISAIEKVGFFVNKTDHLVQLPSQTDALPTTQISPIYNFSYSGVDSSSFPFSIWKRVFRETIDYDETLLKQGDPKGLYELRNSIANYLYNSRGIQTTADDIIISAGTEHLFYLLRRLFNSDTVYGFEDPGYAWGNEFFTYDIEHCSAIPLDDSGIRVDELVKSNVDICLVTPAHQFPTGIVMTTSRRYELLNWAKSGRYIIEDDYDGDFKFSGRPTPSLKSIDSNDSVIYMGSFSKCLTPALRISYMILPKDLMQIYNEAFSGFGCPCSVFIQSALSKFIKDGYFEKHINRMRQLYSKKHMKMLSLLKGIKGIKVQEPHSGTSFSVEVDTELNSNEFAKLALKHGVGITPVDRFSHNGVKRNMYLLGFTGMDTSDIETGLQILDDIISKKRRI